MARNIGKMIDKLYELKLEHDKTLAAAGKAKDKYDTLRDQVQEELKRQDLDGANGERAKVSLFQKINPTISDYVKFERYVYKNKALHLMNKAPNTKAWKEELDSRKGRPVPGITTFNRITMRLTKRR